MTPVFLPVRVTGRLRLPARPVLGRATARQPSRPRAVPTFPGSTEQSPAMVWLVHTAHARLCSGRPVWRVACWVLEDFGVWRWRRRQRLGRLCQLLHFEIEHLIQTTCAADVFLLCFADGGGNLAERLGISLGITSGLAYDLRVAIDDFDQTADVQKPLPGIGQFDDGFLLLGVGDIERSGGKFLRRLLEQLGRVLNGGNRPLDVIEQLLRTRVRRRRLRGGGGWVGDGCGLAVALASTCSSSVVRSTSMLAGPGGSRA